MSAECQDATLVIRLSVPADTEAVVELPSGYRELCCGELSGERLILAAGDYTIVAK